MEDFASDISKLRLFSLKADDPDELADTYNCVLSELLDTHAPLKTKTITVHPPAPWYNKAIIDGKRIQRHVEKMEKHWSLCA